MARRCREAAAPRRVGGPPGCALRPDSTRPPPPLTSPAGHNPISRHQVGGGLSGIHPPSWAAARPQCARDDVALRTPPPLKHCSWVYPRPAATPRSPSRHCTLAAWPPWRPTQWGASGPSAAWPSLSNGRPRAPASPPHCAFSIAAPSLPAPPESRRHPSPPHCPPCIAAALYPIFRTAPVPCWLTDLRLHGQLVRTLRLRLVLLPRSPVARDPWPTAVPPPLQLSHPLPPFSSRTTSPPPPAPPLVVPSPRPPLPWRLPLSVPA